MKPYDILNFSYLNAVQPRVFLACSKVFICQNVLIWFVLALNKCTRSNNGTVILNRKASLRCLSIQNWVKIRKQRNHDSTSIIYNRQLTNAERKAYGVLWYQIGKQSGNIQIMTIQPLLVKRTQSIIIFYFLMNLIILYSH